MERELDAAFQANRYNHMPEENPFWHPYESEEAYWADRHLAAHLGQDKAQYMFAGEMMAFMKVYREAYAEAKRLGAELHILEPDNLQHEHRPSWWPYASEADYLADRELLVLIGFNPAGSIDWTPAHLKERMKPYREAYHAAFERSGQPEPEPVLEEQPEPERVTPHIDIAALATAAEQEPPAKPELPPNLPVFLKRLIANSKR